MLPKAASLIEPLYLFEVPLERLHDLWPFILNGLKDVQRRMQPDWMPEDIYRHLADGNSRCIVAQRGTRRLGFVVYTLDATPYSKTKVLFLRAAWNLKLRDRQELDNLPEAVSAVWRMLETIAKTTLGAALISWWTTSSRARAYQRKYGWLPKHTSFYVPVD